MPMKIHERHGKTQIGSTTGTSGYVQGGGDINFATGQAIHIRMKSYVPKGAVINSALFRFMMVAKNAGTTQTCYNSIRAHAIGDAPPLTVGVAEGTRPWTAARVEWTATWVSVPNDTEVFLWVNIAPVVQEIVNRSDYQAGGYISFMVYTDNENGSDMGIRANNDFAPSPRLHIDYTTYDDWQYDINLASNPNLDALPYIDSTPLPFWSQGNFFGAFVDPANQGVIARDTSFTRVAGVPTMRFTTGTPPGDNKRTGPYTFTPKQGDLPYIFCGWTYIPSAVTGEVFFGDPYLGKSQKIILRNQWVPFCSYPTDITTSSDYAGFYPAVQFAGGWQAGWQIWVSEPTILHSPFRRMPFNGRTPNVVDPGGSIIIDHRMTGPQTATRQWLPRRAVLRNGTLIRRPTYSARADGLLVNAEPVKGGPQVQNLPATAISAYPAGKTISEL